eukprot:scaffold34835_cov18-Tisochrysis_lutea.AAC.2
MSACERQTLVLYVDSSHMLAKELLAAEADSMENTSSCMYINSVFMATLVSFGFKKGDPLGHLAMAIWKEKGGGAAVLNN